jgi:hypothetical protein
MSLLFIRTIISSGFSPRGLDGLFRQSERSVQLTLNFNAESPCLGYITRSIFSMRGESASELLEFLLRLVAHRKRESHSKVVCIEPQCAEVLANLLLLLKSGRRSH